MATINTNVAAQISANALAKNDREMTKAMERLATGSRINSASDDAAGLAGLAQLCSLVQPDIVVVTGLVPYERRHSYYRLREPCDDLVAWAAVQKLIANKFKTDKTVSNPSRIMRVPGTISFPPKRKQARGYVTEIVTLREAW